MSNRAAVPPRSKSTAAALGYAGRRRTLEKTTTSE
jgi:hypothetical protein